MKPLLTTFIAICVFTLTCSAQWTTGTSPYVYLTTTSNNVGIGITNPLSKLVVAPGVTDGTINRSLAIVTSTGQTDFGGYIGQRVINGNTRQGLMVSGTASLTLQAQAYNLDFITGTANPSDDSNLRMRILSNGNVGIGATNPTQPLQIISTNPAGTFGTFASTSGQGLTINPNSIAGTVNVFSDYLNSGTEPKLHLSTAAGRFNSAGITIATSGNVGIGTANPDQALTVNGNIHSKSVIVDLSIAPDYVFKPTYKLPTLEYVKNYVDKNSHLPEVPSEAEIKKNGLDVGEMNAVLLKKVEELTLYMIEKDKQIKQLQTQVKKLQNRKK